MADRPADASASVAPRFGPRLCRSLGVREGVDLEARFEPGPFPVLAVLDPDGTSRRFLLADAVEEATGERHLVFLRILPLDTAGTSGSEQAASLARWRQEWSDFASITGGNAGAARPAAGVQNLGGGPRVLPPLYFCPARKVLIPAVCQGHPGPGDGGEPAAGDLCSLCGSPTADEEAESAATALTPLEALWEHVRQRGEAASSPEPFEPHCVRCDKRETCYPAAGPSTEAGAAGGILVPLTAERPWGGVVVQPFHLPITAWYRLASGSSWTSVRRDLKALPAAILEEIEARLREDRRFLFSSESSSSLGLEFLLLKLETLRQILVALADLAIHRGHPHLDLRPETVWVRLEPGDSLRPVLWSWRLVLLDLAPGLRSEGGGDGATYTPAEGRPTAFTPPGCGKGEDWIGGTCVVKSSGAFAEQGIARIEFLPSAPFDDPPRKGDAVRVEVPVEGPQGPRKILPGRVDAIFPEMCRILLHDPALKAEEMQEILSRGGGGSKLRLKVIRDHSLVDDLFAAGTFWIASLLVNPGDVAAAARFRDDLRPKLRGTRPGGGDTLVRESLKAAEASHLFSLGTPQPGSDPGAAAKLGMAPLDPDLLARSLALGMRLCGAVPAGYPCQQHEPAGIEERARAYDTILSLLTELGRQVRQGMLATEAPGDDLLPALGRYALERASPSHARRPFRSTVIARKPKGDV